LERSEGVLLRYLSEAYRALERTVPDACKTPELYDVIDWLGSELRSVDASLLEEWQRLANPEVLLEEQPRAPAERNVTSDTRAFTALVRNACFSVVAALARRHFTGARELLERLAPDPTISALELEARFAPYFAEYESLRADPPARAPRYLEIEKGATHWQVRQILLDPAEDLGWSLQFEVDLAASARDGVAVVRLLDVTAN
ncbi:MAG TPA: DUF3516 domain-containing protein, partial [Polyangiaceae bacterium]|nr:DUF3516 domain-containing protein [Polyangiaceae bacterium]